MLYSRLQYSMISENTQMYGMGLRIDEFKLKRHLNPDEVGIKKYYIYKMTRLNKIRDLIQQIVKQIGYNYNLLKVAKKLRDMYNKIRSKRPTTKSEEAPESLEYIRYLFENYPYYESQQRVFPNSIGMYVIDMKEYSTEKKI
jgi:hypothetical protein